MNKTLRILYDITEIGQLVGRDIAGILFRLYNTCETPTGQQVEDLVKFWVHDTLDHTHTALLKQRPNPQAIGEARLVNSLRHELHPAYTRLLMRIVRLPPVLHQHEVRSVDISLDTLALVFDTDGRLDQDLKYVHHLAHRRHRSRAAVVHPNLLRDRRPTLL